MSDSELFYHIALTLVPGVGPVAGKSLISYCGGAEAVFTEKKSRLANIPGIGKNIADSIFNFQNFSLVEDELKFINDNQIRAIYYSGADYPMRLKQEMDGPLVLFVKGEINLNHTRVVGIVGTRKITQYGQEITKKLVQELKAYDVHTISGLAYGVDIAAHKASLEADIPSIAVVAHGLDILYPGQHKSHAKKMIEQGGAIITEHFSGTALNPDLFPRRNRIVAAMCDALIVVESKKRGGSMITAEIAHSYNRDVFAVPGRALDTMSEGCNYLIKSLRAVLCESAGDIAQEMNWELPENTMNKKPIQNQLFVSLNPEERAITTFLQSVEKSFEDILIHTGYSVARLNFLLIDMEMRGLVKSYPGKKYGLH